MTCIEINPGAKKVIKGTPRISPLSAPIARDKTSQKSKDEISGEKIVCIQTIKNLKTSFLYKVQAPTQLINPNLLDPILYFFVNSTIDSLITLIKKNCAKLNLLTG